MKAEARAQEEHDHRIQDEAAHIMHEKVARVARQDKRVREKLMELLDHQITQEAFQEDLEAEESEPVGTEDLG